MNKNYTKPIIVANNNLSEGVYLASGAGNGGSCYTATANIHQTPGEGRGDYRIQVNGIHAADHERSAQTLTISFNQPVNYVSSQGALLNGDGSNVLTIALSYHQNPNDNIGLGDLVVASDPGLAVTGVTITD